MKDCSHHGGGLSVKDGTSTVPLLVASQTKLALDVFSAPTCFPSFPQPLSLKWRESNKRINFPLQISDIPLYQLLPMAYEFVLWAGICF